MRKKSGLFCLLLICLVALTISEKNKLQLSSASEDGTASELIGQQVQIKSNQRDFDYFYFVRQWPAGYCSVKHCTELAVDDFQFTIHGLWPNYDDGTYPQFCHTDEPFRESLIEDLLPEMDEEWPSFSAQGEDSFWKHEWEKHGTCALSVLPSEHSYFNEALKLHEKYSLKVPFKAESIYPSNEKTYRKDDMLNAIYDEYGVRAQVHCMGDTLVEVWLCVDRHLQVYSCEKTRSSYEECPDDIRFPPVSKAS